MQLRGRSANADLWAKVMDSRSGRTGRPGESPPAEVRALPAPSEGGRIEAALRDSNASTALALPTEDPAFRRQVQEALGQVLLRRRVPEHFLRSPEDQLYFSAIQVLRQGTHREEILNVLAACMDRRTGHKVLPSYVDVIRQLSRDELELVRHLPKIGRSAPITHVNVVLPTNQSVVVYRNVLPESYARLCMFKDNIPQYVDNLARLGLVVVRTEDEASANTYRAMARFPFVRELLRGAPEGSRLAMTPSIIARTDFGEGICQACFE